MAALLGVFWRVPYVRVLGGLLFLGGFFTRTGRTSLFSSIGKAFSAVSTSLIMYIGEKLISPGRTFHPTASSEDSFLYPCWDSSKKVKGKRYQQHQDQRGRIVKLLSVNVPLGVIIIIGVFAVLD